MTTRGGAVGGVVWGAVGVLSVLCLSAVAGCSSAEEPYKPAPVWAGRAPQLPTPPPIDLGPVRSGDAFTVAGASHHLRSRVHSPEITRSSIAISGYIVQESYTDAPACAVHRVGQKDPDDCPPAGAPPIEVPSFWIADSPSAGVDAPRIRVVGFAKNVATLYEAMQKYRGLGAVKDPAKDLYKDKLWNVEVPFPIPAVGAKVKVTGRYGFTFSKASTGLVSDPVHGIMTYEKVEYLEPAPKPASFNHLR